MRHAIRGSARRMLAVSIALLVWALSALPAHADETPSVPVASAGSVISAMPVLAYYYIWFDPSSWQRAKIDTPLAGTYSSDEISVMRTQVALAKAAGIDGFLVSWKDTAVLSSRLANVVKVAQESDFKLGIVYQGLDFARKPLPVSKLATDLRTFADKYAHNSVFDIFGKPLIIITGSGQYSVEALQQITAPVRDRLMVLAAARTVEEYRSVASVVAGSAYYWGAANPDKSWYPQRLAEMAAAVREKRGLWIAPVAPGFDARLVGGSSVVPREGGQTLRKEFAAALASKPDAIGLISWNEYSENTHVEPSTLYRDEALGVVAEMTGSPAVDIAPLDSSTPATATSRGGLNGVMALLLMVIFLGGVFIVSRWRRPGPDLPSEGVADDGAPRGGRHAGRSGR